MSRIVYDMDGEWRFCRGDFQVERKNSHAESYTSCKAGAGRGPAAASFRDDGWREVSLPHDYLSESEFSPDALLSHGYRKRENAWYRKVFLLDESLRDKQLLLVFEGTAVNATFYFNGSLMARSFSAYTETVIDITPRAHFGEQTNVLAVHINGMETEGWWYEGAGIYRHVRLYAKEHLHIGHNGIWAKPVFKEGTKNSWRVDLTTTVENSAYTDGKATVRATLTDGERVVAESVSRPTVCGYASETEVKQSFSVRSPKRWDVDSPHLYTLRVAVYDGEREVDADTVRIGFRTFSVDAEHGFFLNGRPLKLYGTCNHQDHAGVGTAIPDSMQYYRIRRLKELGTNAYRSAHNLPTKELLDACDEYGLIVMDENRRFETRDEVLGYIECMVKRDRNHPSVIFYSLFNEEPLQNSEEGRRIYLRMKSVVTRLDDTRLLTGASNGNIEGSGLEMDVSGVNYHIHEIESIHALHPTVPLIGSENNSAVSTRGCYRTDRETAQVLDNYGAEVVPWGQTIFETFDFARRHEYFSGFFIWTGFDYRGEPTPFKWPSVSSQFGIMDTCGFPKDSYYFNQACFLTRPVLHILPHWNHKKGEVVRVMAATNCEAVELFLNGHSLGVREADPCRPPEWQVPFVPGRLVAKGYRGGRIVIRDEVRTAGKPYAIRALPDRTLLAADGKDTLPITLTVVDKRGVTVPHADHLLRFSVEGGGRLRGVGNGNPNSHESDILPERRLFAGHCQILITSLRGASGEVTVRAEGEGLLPATVTLTLTEVPLSPTIDAHRAVTLSAFTATAPTQERPDPLVVIADNDMNSLMPVNVETSNLQEDFKHGYRLYRCVFQTPSAKKQEATYTLSFRAVRAAAYEIYLNGVLLAEGKQESRAPLKLTFCAPQDTAAELRILFKAREGDPCGIAEGVLIFAEE